MLRPHARGGLGEVSVALDQELDRQVALKEIQEKHADDPASRARFVQEAEITGKLEHPGIIPVYGLGHDASGRPFYAMRFIAGDSLREAIAAFHDRSRQHLSRDARNARLRELLRRFTDVCNAVAYAHSRGVLHRDLKPGNIMLGPYGETLVVDWGLAKAAGAATRDPTTQPTSPDHVSSADPESLIRLSSQSGPRSDTLAGSPMGTPAYASPEQVTGNMERLGTATDIYGLGATLYALLTGRPPVVSEDLMEVIQRVCKGDIPPPTSIDPTVPKPLESICRKAMALEPHDRYSSARALAEDVTRWLDDAPVMAYREPLSVRIGRYIRRHQRMTSSAAAAVLVGLIALWIAYVHESGINQKLRVAIIENRISNQYERFGGTTAEIDFVVKQIDELAEIAPEKAAAERRTLGEQLVAAIGRMIRQERALSLSDADRIREAIGRANEFAPATVAGLDAALRDRLGNFSTVLALNGPFDRLPDAFEPGLLRVSGGGLIAGANAPSGNGPPLILSKVSCDGAVEMEATFTLTPGSTAGRTFGLALTPATITPIH